jgi:hypothetical protein
MLEETTMKYRIFVLSLAIVLLVGCASFQQYGSKNGPGSVLIDNKSYDIVGPVRTEMIVRSVLGFPPFGGVSLALFTWGDATYDALLQEAYKLKADDVINITLDTGTFSILTFFYNAKKYIANGLAIRYKDSEKPRAIILQ